MRAADRYRAQPTQENLLEMQRVVAPPRQELFRRLNRAPGGTATLVAIRRGVLSGLKVAPGLAGYRRRPCPYYFAPGSIAAFSRSSGSTGIHLRDRPGTADSLRSRP